MRFDEKARENMEAADRLLSRSEDGLAEPLANASASRAYYAAYQAVANCAQEAGVEFNSRGANYYVHDKLPSLAFHRRIIDLDEREALSWLYGLRIKADYADEHVANDEASEAAEIARRLVQRLVGLGRS
ncbi:MAG TPA: HEPN domain-containing protein [Kofleriaceae bacterium]|nr:HEPN domain-containing protein [Kofleriaceae bacterium]